MLEMSLVLLIPAIGLCVVCITYSATFMWLAATRGAGGRPAVGSGPINPIRDDKWIIVIPVIGNPALLEICVSSALWATSGAEAVIIVAIDDRDRSSRLRSQRAVEKASGERVLRNLGQDRPSVASRRVICVPTGAILKQCSRSGKASAVNLALSRYLSMEEDASRPDMPSQDNAPYLLCLDVDERLAASGFGRLRAAAAANPDIALIQAPKRDTPVTPSLFARAFSAAYCSWFKWEAGWPATRSSAGAGSSYYGSMAAIKLSPELFLHRRTIGSADARRIELFPEDCAVEDYSFSLSLSPNHGTLLLDRPIGVGCAPPDMAALFTMWNRWAKGNISVAASGLRDLLCQPGRSVGERVARMHHALSWYASIAVGLVPIALAGVLICKSRDAIWVLLLVSATLAGEWIRRLVPAWPASMRDLALRLPIDMLLWPMGVNALVGVWRSTDSGFAPVTPRVAGSRSLPRWIWCAYGVEIAIVLYAAMLAVEARHALLSGMAVGMAGMPFGVGMLAAWHDRRLATCKE